MRILLVIIIAFTVSFGVNAQIVQKGVVKEYNEKAQKTPLSGVELTVRSANSTVSDKKGNFSLNFLTLKPGEKVNVRRIEKLGYEIFNKEAIEQWNLNPVNPFIIVMCKSEKFKKIRDNYEKVSSESYAKQLKKEEAALAKLKADGKLKDEEYQKQLYELRENYEKRLDNIENYIDRFARIDISELSSTEQEIIDLVQQGLIEEAISKYEHQNYIEKYKQEVIQTQEISSAIEQLTSVKESKQQACDSLSSILDRQIELLQLAGGKENFDKAATMLSEIANSDKSNKANLWKYISFLDMQSLSTELTKPLEIYFSLPLTVSEKINALRIKIKSLINLASYEEAESYISELTHILSQNTDDKQGTSLSPLDVAKAYFTIGGIYMDCNHPEKAQSYFKKGAEILPLSENTDFPDFRIALNLKTALAISAIELGDKETFTQLANEQISLAEEIINSDYPFDTESDLLKSLADIGQLAEMSSQYERAASIYSFVEKCYRVQLPNNPINILPKLEIVLQAEGVLMQKTQQYEECEKKYLEALECCRRWENKSPQKARLTMRIIYNNLSMMFLKTKELEKALEVADSSYNIIHPLYMEAPYYYSYPFRLTCIALGRVHQELENLDKAEALYLQAQDLNKDIFLERGDKYIETYWRNSLDLALFYMQLGKEDMGINIMKELVDVGERFIDSTSPYYSTLQSIYFFLGRGYRMTKDYANAEKVIKNYIQNNPDKGTGHLELARIKAYLGETEQAKACLNKALELSPNIIDGIDKKDIILTLIEKDQTLPN